MATLNARVTELEKKAGGSGAMPWLLILTGFGEADDPLTKLACHRTGKVWEIRHGETEADFTSRIEREAFPDGKTGCLLVTRVL